MFPPLSCGGVVLWRLKTQRRLKPHLLRSADRREASWPGKGFKGLNDGIGPARAIEGDFTNGGVEMAGSYRHITYGNGDFRGQQHLCDHMGDAYGAFKECCWLIKYLAGGDLNKIFEAHRAYVAAPDGCNNPEYADKMKYEHFWDVDDTPDQEQPAE